MAEAQAPHSEASPYGGQAVIEGVMMRGKEMCAVAVRKDSGEIATISRPVDSPLTRYPFLNTPVLRGMIALYDTLRLGVWAVQWSGEALMGRPASPWAPVLGVVIALALFIFLPERVAALTSRWLRESWQLNVFEGLVRFGIFGLYFLLVSRLKEVQRIFRYHGAEHRTINAFEAGVPLEVERIQHFSSIHERCGTNFIVVVLVITLLVFSVLPWSTFGERIVLRFILLPLIAGASYELIRGAARRPDLRWLRPLMIPGEWLQRLTTGVPDDGQVEVALRSFETLRSAEAAHSGTGAEAGPAEVAG